MRVGEMVIVRVNGGVETEAQIIEIHGDIVRVCGAQELAIVRAAGREPVGVGFRIQDVAIVKKAKTS